MNRFVRISPSLLLAFAVACHSDSTSATVADPCRASGSITPRAVMTCMRDQGALSAANYRDADSVLSAAQSYMDSLETHMEVAVNQNRRNETYRAAYHLADYYNRGLLVDSQRFNRIIDHIAVTLEYERGLVPISPLRYRPRRTPALTWVYYQNLGIYAQPVTSVQTFAFNFPAPWQPTDSLKMVGEALYKYAIWRTSKSGLRFPVWEYYFPWNTGGWAIPDPWRSAMSQGLAMFIFTEIYDREHDVKWKNRAYEVLNSYKTSFDEGGVLTPDSTHGPWWEEYVPTVQVWNGSVTALLELDYFSKVFNDADARKMVASGLQAVKYFTPFYDTGRWCIYSRVQGDVNKGYMAYHVQLADTLYARTGDVWFRALADKWRAYTPPPGVSDFVPFQPGANEVMPPVVNLTP